MHKFAPAPACTTFGARGAAAKEEGEPDGDAGNGEVGDKVFLGGGGRYQKTAPKGQAGEVEGIQKNQGCAEEVKVSVYICTCVYIHICIYTNVYGTEGRADPNTPASFSLF